MATVSNWILKGNLKPLVEVLSWLAAYKIAPGELEAIELAVEDTDTDQKPQRWYADELRGTQVINFKIGWDRGTEVLLVQLEVPDQLADKSAMALDLMNQYRLSI